MWPTLADRPTLPALPLQTICNLFAQTTTTIATQEQEGLNDVH